MSDGARKSSVTNVRITSTPVPASLDTEAFGDYAPLPAADARTVISRRPGAGGAPAEMPLQGPFRPQDIGVVLEGQKLGHFQLEEFIGGGGMGAVFRATDTSLDRIVAVKVVAKHANDEDMLRRFRNEAQSAARLDHPNIARVYYVGEDKGWQYIVFEFIEGVNVRELVEHRGPLPEQEVVSYTLQMAEALEHASQREVVHRDIKPSNILIMPDGRAKLVDMGLARLHQVDAPSHDLTASGVTLGTFDYISPEQARDPRTADVRSDLYSLGCTLYYMMTALPPYPDGTVLQKLLSHSTEPTPDPRDRRPDVDDDLAVVAMKLMAKQPGQRFQTPADLIADLVVLADRLDIPHEGLTVVISPPPRTSWKQMAISALAYLVPLLILVTVAVGSQMSAPGTEVMDRNELRPQLTPEPVHTLPDAGAKPTESSVANDQENATPSSVPSSESSPADSTNEKSKVNQPPTSIDNRTIQDVPANAISSETTEPKSETAGPTEKETSTSPAASRPAVESSPTSAIVPVGSLEPATSTIVPTINPPAGTVVVDSNADRRSSPWVVSTLDAAVQLANSDSSIDTIELHFDQIVESSLILSPKNTDRPLLIKAAPGYTPLVVLRPSLSDPFADRSLIRLLGGRYSFEDVHFRMEINGLSADQWDLFRMNNAKSVTMKRCTLTICNDFGVNSTFYYIERPSSSPLLLMLGTPSNASAPLSLRLESCVVRGQANLIQAVEGTPFWLSWKQGLLATSRVAILAGGLEKPHGGEPIRINLSRVTADVQEGLCKLRRQDSSQGMPRLDVNCENCVIRHDSDAPLVEHVDTDSLDVVMRTGYLQSGERNFYPQTQIRWRIRPRNGDVVDILWDDELGDWYDERSAFQSTPWKSALPHEGKPVYAYSVLDFELESEQAGMAGCDAGSLPWPPELRVE